MSKRASKIQENTKIGLVAGNFDVIHPGYVRLFEDAKTNQWPSTTPACLDLTPVVPSDMLCNICSIGRANHLGYMGGATWWQRAFLGHVTNRLLLSRELANFTEVPRTEVGWEGKKLDGHWGRRYV